MGHRFLIPVEHGIKPHYPASAMYSVNTQTSMLQEPPCLLARTLLPMHHFEM